MRLIAITKKRKKQRIWTIFEDAKHETYLGIDNDVYIAKHTNGAAFWKVCEKIRN